MRKIICLFALSFVFALICSCSKTNTPSYQSTCNQLSESISGKYKYDSIIIEGRPIDLNNDGISNNDLLKEYCGLSSEWIINKEDALVIHNIQPFSFEILHIPIPLQGVEIDQDTALYKIDPYSIYGSAQFVPSIGCDSNGLTIKYGNFLFNGHFRAEEDMFDHLTSAKLLSLNNGVLVFSFYAVFYDFSTNAIVDGLVTATMIRHSTLR